MKRSKKFSNNKFYEVPNSESLFGAYKGLLRMKYYKFNRDRSFAAKFCRLTHSRKKLSYMIGTGRSRFLDSYYFESQTWGALHKAWKGYIIVKHKDEIDRLYYYAEVIQKLQRELGLPVSSFPFLGLSHMEQAHDASEDYYPADNFEGAMRSEQNYNPSEEFDRAMRSEKVWGKNMRKMSIVIKDETEERLRRAIADYKGVKKGKISKAIEEAINLWIDRKSEIHRRGQGEAKIRW